MINQPPATRRTPWYGTVMLAGIGLPLSATQQDGLPIQAVGPAGDLAAQVEVLVEGQAHPEFQLTWMLLPPELQIVDKTAMELGHEPMVEFKLIHSCVIPGAWLPEFVKYNKAQDEIDDPQIGPCNWIVQNPQPAQSEPRLSQGASAFSLRVDAAGKLKPLYQPRFMGFRRCSQPPLLEITFQNRS